MGFFVYTCTHTRTQHMGYWYSFMIPGFGTRNLEGPKNHADGLNLGIYVFVFVYKVHVCMYMLGGGIDLGLTACFF